MGVHGLLLAGGAGRRYGGPKALAHDPDGSSWLRRSVAAMYDGGCRLVTVVLGADADTAILLLEGTHASFVVADDWAEGMSASLQAGLHAADRRATAALLHLVDLPDVGADVIARIIAEPVRTDTLRRAGFDGEPGHPVLLGRDHWDGVHESAFGDRGARDYLAAHPVEQVECGDLATGADVDTSTAR